MFGFRTTTVITFKKASTVELSVCPKMGNSRCFTYVTVPYNVRKDIKLNDVAFKSETMNIDNAKVKPKTRSQ